MPAAVRFALRVRAVCWTIGRDTGPSKSPARERFAGDTSTLRWFWRRNSRPQPAGSSSPTRSRWAPTSGATSSAARSPHALLRRVECTAGTIELTMELAPRPAYGMVRAGAAGGGGRPARDRRGTSCCFPRVCRSSIDGGAAQCRRVPACGRVPDVRAAAPGRRTPGDCWSQEEVEHRLAETVAAWRSWSAMHQHYEGPWQELVQRERTRAAGSHVPADRRHRRRAHDLTARDGGRRAELGLSLLLDPRRVPHAGGALGGGLSRRSQSVLRFPREGRAAAAPPGAAVSRSCSG